MYALCEYAIVLACQEPKLHGDKMFKEMNNFIANVNDARKVLYEN